MFNFIKKLAQINYFCLEINNQAIRVLQNPQKKAEIILQKKQTPTQAIKLALKKAQIKQKNISLVLQEKNCFIKPIKEKKQSIKKQIEANVPMPIEQIYYTWKKSKGFLFTAAADKTQIDKQIDLVEQCGLKPIIIEPQSLAISRALMQNEKQVCLIVHIQKQNILFIIANEKMVLFSAQQEYGCNINDEINRYIGFYQSEFNQNIEKIILNSAQGQNIKINNSLPVANKNPLDLPSQYCALAGLYLRKAND